jgi:diacylglycerol kinase (ATP)
VGVVLLVVMGKALFGKGQVLRGGMPSGHAAVAFSAATSVAFLSHSFLTIVLTGLLAVMVAQSRLLFRIHSFREVFMGCLLGVLFTILVFQLIR